MPPTHASFFTLEIHQPRPQPCRQHPPPNRRLPTDESPPPWTEVATVRTASGTCVVFCPFHVDCCVCASLDVVLLLLWFYRLVEWMGLNGLLLFLFDWYLNTMLVGWLTWGQVSLCCWRSYVKRGRTVVIYIRSVFKYHGSGSAVCVGGLVQCCGFHNFCLSVRVWW